MRIAARMVHRRGGGVNALAQNLILDIFRLSMSANSLADIHCRLKTHKNPSSPLYGPPSGRVHTRPEILPPRTIILIYRNKIRRNILSSRSKTVNCVTCSTACSLHWSSISLGYLYSLHRWRDLHMRPALTTCLSRIEFLGRRPWLFPALCAPHEG